LLFEHALPAARRRDVSDPCAQFLQVHHRWLVDGQPTPFHYIDNLLAYALGAGKDVGGKPSVTWSGDRQTLIYRGERLPLEQLRGFVSELLEAAEEVLGKELLFLSDSWQIDLREVVDDMTETTCGYWFGRDAKNRLTTCGAQALRRLAASEDAGKSILRLVNGRELKLRSAGWRRFLHQLQRFQTLLFLLVHLCSGAPARGVEVLPVRYVNAPHAPRNVFVHDGQVAVVTAYHKSQSITGQHKVIARFLPGRVG
jgi:hypothetical protein